MTLDFITLEDNKEYAVVNTMEVNNNKYLFLAAEDDPKNVLLRKVINEDNSEYLIKLDSNEEYDNVMREFIKKYRMDDKNEE